MNTLKLPLAAALLLGASFAQAEITANVALTTDYVWRGVSQSDEDPAIQGGLDYSHDSGFYLGAWGSNVDFDEAVADPADLELDLYGGYATEIAGIGVDLGVIGYQYPGASADLDWAEYSLALSYDAFSASINYSNDVFASSEAGVYYHLGYERALGSSGYSVSAGVGHYDFDGAVNGAGQPDSYTDWNLGVATEIGGVGLDLSYHDTDDDGETLYGSWAGSRLVFSVSKAL